jgi:hypothetical protein
MNLSFSPIGPWPVVAVTAVGIMALTVWAYWRRMRGTSGGWRWVALGLRVAAVLLCLVASVRLSVVIREKTKQRASIVFLLDDSSSMTITDEANSSRRWDAARRVLEQGQAAARVAAPDLDVKTYRFNAALAEHRTQDDAPPQGRETALGAALMEVVSRQMGSKLAALVVLSDGASNAGLAPLTAAQRLRSLQVPVVTVGFGSESAGAHSRDLAVREVVTPPSVFVKNQVDVRATLGVRGYADEPIDVELLAEGRSDPVATTRVRAAVGKEVVAVSGLKFTPLLAGETKLTVRVKPKDGELLLGNNEYSTFVTVLRGGLSVLYLQGPNFTWEYRYLYRALDPAREIQAELKVIRRPGELQDAEIAPGKVDVYILGDVAASLLTPTQQRLLVRAVENGAGLLMLGGRSSFGAGGWARTPLAQILPVTIGPGDGQVDPEGGLKVVPNFNALDSYVLQLGSNRSESARLWSELPPISGANRLGLPKPASVVLAQTAGSPPEPLMVSQEVGRGRVLVFGGETWPWARALDDALVAAHHKFWRQSILWLAHKEDTGESRVELRLDRRRIAIGQKIALTVVARDPKDQPIADAQYKAIVTFVGPNAKPEPVDLYNQGTEARGTYFATGSAGEYRVTVTAAHNGQEIGTATSRFLVYQDDRELENPAANLALLKQIAELTGGQSLPPEQLVKYLKTLDGKMYTEYSTLAEYRAWDNWPFLLVFIAVLAAEWWLRKLKGWV